MTDTRGPWYFATLVVACPACGSAPGALCRDGERDRERFHLERYGTARALAGLPLKRLTSPVHP